MWDAEEEGGRESLLSKTFYAYVDEKQIDDEQDQLAIIMWEENNSFESLTWIDSTFCGFFTSW